MHFIYLFTFSLKKENSCFFSELLTLEFLYIFSQVLDDQEISKNSTVQRE